MKIDFSHHAYCLEGDKALAKGKLFRELEKSLKFKIRANPDLWIGEFDTFGIDDSKSVSNFQSRKSVAGERKVVVIKTNFMTREAQNSLLKTFEEPSPGTHFFLIIPSADSLLPTLRSRVMVEKIMESNKFILGKKFLNASKKERLDTVKEMADNKDKPAAIDLLNQIENIISKKIESGKGSSEEIILAETISKFRSYLNDRAPNIKMILEHIALISPEKV